jgi:SAM-dependent methyltransferase
LGDVALLAAGLGAEVVAVERDPATLDRARARAGGAAIQFVEGVIPEFAVDGAFDVICGRLILMYLRDPAAALRALAARYLRPAGRIAFVEYDMAAGLALPSPALARRSLEAIVRVFAAAGCPTDLGLRLPSVYAAAGFAAPKLDAMLWTAAIDDDAGFDMIAGVQQAQRPLAERLGLAELIDPDLATLPDRLRAAVRTEGVLVGPLVVGAVATRAD